MSTRIRGEFNSDMLSFTDLPGGSQILTLFFYQSHHGYQIEQKISRMKVAALKNITV